MGNLISDDNIDQDSSSSITIKKSHKSQHHNVHQHYFVKKDLLPVDSVEKNTMETYNPLRIERFIKTNAWNAVVILNENCSDMFLTVKDDILKSLPNPSNNNPISIAFNKDEVYNINQKDLRKPTYDHKGKIWQIMRDSSFNTQNNNKDHVYRLKHIRLNDLRKETNELLVSSSKKTHKNTRSKTTKHKSKTKTPLKQHKKSIEHSIKKKK